jgi:hypothetical protein
VDGNRATSATTRLTPSRRRSLRRVGLLVLALAVTVVVIDRVGRIDWDAVGEAR